MEAAQQQQWTWLDLQTPRALNASIGQVAGRISILGARMADAQLAMQRAKYELELERAQLYQLARVTLEEGRPAPEGKSAGRGPTEAQVEAHMRTDPDLSARLLAASERFYLAEADYEVARSNYKAVCVEADMAAEAARNRRAEMANLDPTLRFLPPAQLPPPTLPPVQVAPPAVPLDTPPKVATRRKQPI